MIIAIKDKDRVVLGYLNTDRWSAMCENDYVDEENVAIKFTNKDTTFALCESDRRSDLLLYEDTFLNIDINPKSIVKEVIPYIKHQLKENDIPIKDGSWENALIICDNEHLYDVNTSFGFREIDDYVCHGYNMSVVKSALDSLVDLPAEERIIKAIKFVEKMYKIALFPLVLTNTKDKQLKTIYRGEDVLWEF